MKAIRIGAVLAALIPVGLIPAPSEAALPHGCISATNDYTLSFDAARHSLGFGLYENEPCSFYYSPGDTYSGTGEYVITCSTGGKANDPLSQGPVTQVPIPQPCDPGAVVTIYANQPFRGGFVIAGSLA